MNPLRLPVLAASLGLLAAALVATPGHAQPDQGRLPAAPASAIPLPGIAPIPGPTIFTGAMQDVDDLGYTESEYVVTLRDPKVYSYIKSSTRVRVADAPSSPQGRYRSRIIVRAPQDPADFNGRVLVEMMNTTAMLDIDVAWQQAHEHLVREGWAYVGITVQQTGLNALRNFARQPDRYTDLGLNLMVPRAARDAVSGSRDPSLAWDLTSQVGALLASERPTNPLAGYDVTSLYLTGQSQMAGYATTYVNAIHPRHRVYDGFLVAYRGGGATNLQYAAPRDGSVPSTSASQRQRRLHGRGAPVIALQSWSDPLRGPQPGDEAAFAAALWRPDSDTPTDRYRLWEIAGASHNDRWGAEQAIGVIRRDTPLKPTGTCRWTAPAGVNDFPARFAWHSALEALARWHEDGVAPADGQRLQRSGTGAAELDALGNPVGGLRLPRIDVPVATYTPTSAPGSGTLALFCPLTGGQTPLSDAELDARYPPVADYVASVASEADADVAAGILLPDDAAALVKSAARGPKAEAQTVREY
ncbi:MAG: alpha/beta hydrolase domain-containing protein [bacterium]